MINKITLELPKPHSGQKKIINEAARFNAVNCGRRFGKTTLGQNLLTEESLQGHPVAWFSPSYKDLTEVWKFIKNTLYPVLKSKNEQIKQLELLTGGIIDFWSLDNPDSGRGRKYKRIIVDEVAKIRDFNRILRQTLRPTLTDLKGDGFFFSTPKGRDNDWFDVCEGAKSKEGWKLFKMPTSSNPYIDMDELAEIERTTPPLDFAQEYNAEFVDFQELMFFYEYSDGKHLSNKFIDLNPYDILDISFDFNIHPTTAILGQKIDGWGCFVYKVIQSTGTYNLCQELLPFIDHPGGIEVTGDFSGNTGNSAAGTLAGGVYNTDFEIIKKELWLSDQQLIRTKEANKKHEYSKRICNHFLFRVPFWINPTGCDPLPHDLRTGRPTTSGKLLKDRQHHCQDAGDSWRYLINKWFPAGYEDINNFAWHFAAE